MQFALNVVFCFAIVDCIALATLCSWLLFSLFISSEFLYNSVLCFLCQYVVYFTCYPPHKYFSCKCFPLLIYCFCSHLLMRRAAVDAGTLSEPFASIKRNHVNTTGCHPTRMYQKLSYNTYEPSTYP
ncbi:hypothetical protein K474DRAFT_455314 [Panus rudis PR-1116 ss-1]|nr:hypothetical protein K474DRAFT_455314 [Panus rudis PR-1116 ss-1]